MELSHLFSITYWVISVHVRPLCFVFIDILGSFFSDMNPGLENSPKPHKPCWRLSGDVLTSVNNTHPSTHLYGISWPSLSVTAVPDGAAFRNSKIGRTGEFRVSIERRATDQKHESELRQRGSPSGRRWRGTYVIHLADDRATSGLGEFECS